MNSINFGIVHGCGRFALEKGPHIIAYIYCEIVGLKIKLKRFDRCIFKLLRTIYNIYNIQYVIFFKIKSTLFFSII